MSRIIVNLEPLIRRKEVLESRTLTIQIIAEETGLNYATVSNWIKNRVDRAELTTIATFCDYFDCDTSDLLSRVKDHDPVTYVGKVKQK